MELWKNVKRMFTDITMTLVNEQPLCPSPNIQTLPEEILIHIFSFLSLGEICTVLPKVCGKWKQLHWDRQLYSMPRTLGKSSTIEYLLKCLDSATNLSSPHYDKRYIIETIRNILVSRNEVRPRAPGELTTLLMILSHLTEVKLMGKESYSSMEFQLEPLVKCCVQLKKVEVWSNSTICIRNEELISLCGQLCGSLRVLQLDDCKWTVEGARALAKCRFLKYLAVAGYNGRLSEECLLEIANMASLRSLRIYGCASVNDQTWITMFSNDGLKGLTLLTLTYINCSDEVAVAIGNNLRNLNNVYIISLVSLGKNGLRSIIEGCNKMTSLVFSCPGSQTSENDILTISNCLPKLKTLYLKLENPKLDSSDWQTALMKKMPGLDILGLDFYGRPK